MIGLNDFAGETITILKVNRKEHLVKKNRTLSAQQNLFDAGDQRF